MCLKESRVLECLQKLLLFLLLLLLLLFVVVVVAVAVAVAVVVCGSVAALAPLRGQATERALQTRISRVMKK